MYFIFYYLEPVLRQIAPPCVSIWSQQYLFLWNNLYPRHKGNASLQNQYNTSRVCAVYGLWPTKYQQQCWRDTMTVPVTLLHHVEMEPCYQRMELPHQQSMSY